MKEQVYDIKNNVIYQDNELAILMEINGRNSCTGNSRHINIRYFWIKDRVDGNEIKIEYLPTHIMLADYYTKRHSGKHHKMVRPIYLYEENSPSTLQGCIKIMDNGKPTRDKETIRRYGTDHKIASVCHKPVTKVLNNARGFRNNNYPIDRFKQHRTHIFR